VSLALHGILQLPNDKPFDVMLLCRPSPTKGSPTRRSGRTPVPEEFFADHEEQVDEEHGGMGEGGRGGLRHRHPALPAAGRGGGAKGSPRAAHSRRAIVPVDDELL
jgi:hypothetical protein